MEPDPGAPNLDAMPYKALIDFWDEASHATYRIARELFPSRRKGYVSVTEDLGHYAINKATAITLRESGDIQRAQVYEAICQKVYDRLPEWARW
jgi:hypothetical protein